MEIQQEDDGKKGAFYVEHDNEILAEMGYVWAGPDKIIIGHTDVHEVLKGKGIGKQMLTRAVAFARNKGIKIFPYAPMQKCI